MLPNDPMPPLAAPPPPPDRGSALGSSSAKKHWPGAATIEVPPAACCMAAVRLRAPSPRLRPPLDDALSGGGACTPVAATPSICAGAAAVVAAAKLTSTLRTRDESAATASASRSVRVDAAAEAEAEAEARCPPVCGRCCCLGGQRGASSSSSPRRRGLRRSTAAIGLARPVTCIWAEAGGSPSAIVAFKLSGLVTKGVQGLAVVVVGVRVQHRWPFNPTTPPSCLLDPPPEAQFPPNPLLGPPP